ncbi:PRC-barrel domain-containing protein [Syntrophomonas erecta subsp. sporosyntropha]
MKKTQEIIGLPVFAIMDGKKIGQVKDLVINPEEGKVDFILVSNGSWYVGARVLLYKAVIGIGEYAVTTESESMLTTINETNNANNLLERNIEIKGNQVLTNRGNLIGVISEYEIDEITGKIIRLEYKTTQDESQMEIVDAGQVLTYGADVVVIREIKEGAPAVETESTLSDNPTSSAADGKTLFKQRQREFLIGKKVIQDIHDDNGEVIIAEGTEVNEMVITLAEKHNKFMELSQCAK